MSFVAKVFIVFNLLLSALFLYFAIHSWTAPTKWQKMYEAEKVKTVQFLAERQKIEVGLAQSVIRSERDTAAMKAQLGQANRAKEEERDKALSLGAELSKERNAKELAEAERQEVTREKDRIQGEVAKARSVVIKIQQALEIERNNATRYKNEKSEAEVALNQISGQLQATNRDNHRLESDLALANARIEKVYSSGNGHIFEGSSDPTMPAVDAQVLAARADIGLVMISAGSQNGIKPGHTFTISRGSEYIGKAVVEKVYPDMCSAKIDPALMAKNQEVQIHDTAKTR